MEMRVWWIRNVPNKASYFDVKSIKEAKAKIAQLTKMDLRDKSIEDNVGGLEVFEDGNWNEYYNDAGKDIMEIMGK